MKKLFLILLTFISFNVFAQNDFFKVKENSFHQIQGYVMLDKKDHYDDNNRPMALIKISTENISAAERRNITFKGNLATYFDVRFEPTEIYLYLSTAATFLEIHHPDYGKTEFTLPYDLKDFCGYEMVLSYIPVSSQDASQQNFLSVISDQDNAVIYIDDEYVGEKEVFKTFPVGSTHSWRIECYLYHTESGNITITAEDNIVEKTLRPAHGYLNVTTSPEDGALVFVNNKKVGETPYKSDKMESGTYKVRVMKDNYKTTEESFVVTDGNTTDAQISMSPVEAPKPASGTLEITSNPMRADIYVDGELIGQTPRVISDLPVGKHELKLQKQGYETLTENIVIEENVTLTLNEKMQVKKESPRVEKKEELVKQEKKAEKIKTPKKTSAPEKHSFITLNVAYSVAPQTSFGITYGQVKKVGWFVSAMTNFNFRFAANEWDDMFYASDNEAVFTGNSSAARASLTAGMLMKLGGPVYMKLGAGYGMRVKCWELSDEWYVYEPDTYKGLDLTAGLMFKLGGCTISADAVTTNFETLEIKVGVGVNFN